MVFVYALPITIAFLCIFGQNWLVRTHKCSGNFIGDCILRCFCDIFKPYVIIINSKCCRRVSEARSLDVVMLSARNLPLSSCFAPCMSFELVHMKVINYIATFCIFLKISVALTFLCARASILCYSSTVKLPAGSITKQFCYTSQYSGTASKLCKEDKQLL